MRTAAGILSILGGIFGIIAAIMTLFFGGLGGVVGAEGAKHVVGLGWLGFLFSLFSIIFGAVVFNPKRNVGIHLLVTALAGMAMGGTLVAFCMSMTFLAGILGLLSKSEKNINEITTESKKKFPIATVSYLIIVALILGALFSNEKKNSADGESVVAETKLQDAQASEIQPYGELAEIFNIGSKSTNLNREEKLKEIRGKVIIWSLPVYEVSKTSNGTYRIQTQSSKSLMDSSKYVATFTYVTANSEDDHKALSALKTGDLVRIKGVLTGETSMRNLEIKPAILFNEQIKAEEKKKQDDASVERTAINQENKSDINSCVDKKVSDLRKEIGEEDPILNSTLNEIEELCGKKI